MTGTCPTAEIHPADSSPCTLILMSLQIVPRNFASTHHTPRLSHHVRLKGHVRLNSTVLQQLREGDDPEDCW